MSNAHFWRCNRELLYKRNSGVAATFSSVHVFLARYQTPQDTLDWRKLSGINERIDAKVQVSDEQYTGKDILVKQGRVVFHNESVDIDRSPGDAEQPADKDHGLNDAVPNLV